MVEMATHVELPARVGVKHPVRAADRPAVAAADAGVPRRVLPVPAPACGAFVPVHVLHPGLLDRDRLLGTRLPDHEDRRKGGDDRGGDGEADDVHRQVSWMAGVVFPGLSSIFVPIGVRL